MPLTPHKSALAECMKPSHKKASQMLGYALMLDDRDGWWGFAHSIGKRLSERERAALSLMALKSLSQSTQGDVIGACQSRAGPPVAPLMGHMDQAAFWADMADQEELAAYCLASFNRMAPARQHDFLEFVQGRAAA